MAAKTNLPAAEPTWQRLPPRLGLPRFFPGLAEVSCCSQGWGKMEMTCIAIPVDGGSLYRHDLAKMHVWKILRADAVCWVLCRGSLEMWHSFAALVSDIVHADVLISRIGLFQPVPSLPGAGKPSVGALWTLNTNLSRALHHEWFFRLFFQGLTTEIDWYQEISRVVLEYCSLTLWSLHFLLVGYSSTKAGPWYYGIDCI